MITESNHDYKGYNIRLRAVTNNGFWYKIEKFIPNPTSPNGLKRIILRQRGYNFIRPSESLQKAKDYIDEFSDVLEEKFEMISKAVKNIKQIK